MKASQHRSGFSLVELLTVIALVVVVVGMLVPAVQKTREAANRSTCENNLKQFGVALNNYAAANQNKLPPMLDYIPDTVGWCPFWFSLVPYMESNSLATRARGTGAAWNAGLHAAVSKWLLCPSEATHRAGHCTAGAVGWAGTSYAPVYPLFGNTTTLDAKTGKQISAGKYNMDNIPDGTANQFAVVERLSSFPFHNWSNAAFFPMSLNYWGWNSYGSAYGVWGLKPPQVNARIGGPDPAHPSAPNSAHAALHALRLDGSVVSVKGPVRFEPYWGHFCTPDDGNVVWPCY